MLGILSKCKYCIFVSDLTLKKNKNKNKKTQSFRVTENKDIQIAIIAKLQCKDCIVYVSWCFSNNCTL